MSRTHLACQYFLNHELRPEELRTQVRQLAEAGFESIYGHARVGLLTPYFSRKWWEAIGVILEECRKNGVSFSIWDEDSFPSATAGNRIVWDHPELAVQSLAFETREAKAGEQVYFPFEHRTKLLGCFAVGKNSRRILDITEDCGTVRTRLAYRALLHTGYSTVNKIPMPHWRASWRDRRFCLDWKAEEDCTVVAVLAVRSPDDVHNTDLLNPATTACILEGTHGEYLRRFGQKTFTEMVDGVFMDEPSPSYPSYPWTDAFPQEFQRQHGFDLMPCLPHLICDIDERSPLIRHCYRMTQHELVCRNYLEQTRLWCRDHQIRSIGHLSRTEALAVCNGMLWPNELRAYKYLDIPCTDPLGAGAAWTSACAYHTGIKVVTSAAVLFGKEQAGSDALAVLGNEVGLRDLKFHLDYQMTLGLTYFNIHGLSYSLDGARKDEVPPSIFYHHPEWPWMHSLLEPTLTACRRLNEGQRICRTAVLYAVGGFTARIDPSQNQQLESHIHLLVENLLSHHRDFDFIDEVTLSEQYGSDPEKLASVYPHFIVPQVEFMESRTADLLEKYASAGGSLRLTGAVPRLLGQSCAAPQKEWARGSEFVRPDYLQGLPGPEITGEGSGDILLQERKISGERVRFLFNRAERPFRGTVDGQAVWLPPCAGEFMDSEHIPTNPLDGTEFRQELRSWEAVFPENHIPLTRWAYQDPEGKAAAALLLQRDFPRLQAGKVNVLESMFLYDGPVRPIRLVIEESTCRGSWKCFVNDREITGFRPSQDFDCRNFTADISGAVLSGTTPTRNVIRFEVSGEAPEMNEMPYLYGEFSAEFRQGSKTMPFLHAHDGHYQLTDPTPWMGLKRGTFSGAVHYQTEFRLEKPAHLKVDLGRVEDLAEVFLDGRSMGVRFTSPYVVDLQELSAGLHRLEVTVCNGPGNRDRLADLDAGLIGPVRLVTVNSGKQ